MSADRFSAGADRAEADVLVTGATGLIGRWLVPALTRDGHRVALLMRDGAARADEIREWTRAHGGDPSALGFVTGDVEKDAELDGLDGVRDVYHLAARFQFGLTQQEARRANVEGSLRVLGWAAGLPSLRRFVMVSGYRTVARSWTSVAAKGWPLADADRDALYARHGAYEASKLEADLAVRTVAAQRGVPLTTVHPASVIGDSRTGESLAQPGFADAALDLWHGRMSGTVRDPDIVAPVVAVDHLASFLAAVPAHDETAGRDYLLLHPDSPSMAAMTGRIAGVLGVPAPRIRLPLSVVRRLPARLSGVDREALAFLTPETYDGTAADSFASSIGLHHPDLTENLTRWADRLTTGRIRRSIAGVRTYVADDSADPEYVLLHGLPLDADSWDRLAELLGGGSRLLRPDLPGLGRSSTTTRVSFSDLGSWADELLEPLPERPIVVGHSLGAAVALQVAQAARELVLISPYFLQRRASWPLRQPWITAPVMRRARPSLLGDGASAALGEGASAALGNLKRPGVARQAAALLAEISTPEHRRRMLEALEASPVPVHLIVGSQDPLLTAPPPNVRLTVIEGAGHNPHLTHPAQVAAALSHRE